MTLYDELISYKQRFQLNAWGLVNIISALFRPSIVSHLLSWGSGLSTIPRPPVHRVVLLQLLITLLVSLLAWIHSDVAALSALLGGFVCAVPNAYFVWRAFRFRGARYAHKVAGAFYQGEAWKFVLTAMMFAVIFSQNWQLNYPALFAGFVAVQLGHLCSAKIANL